MRRRGGRQQPIGLLEARREIQAAMTRRLGPSRRGQPARLWTAQGIRAVVAQAVQEATRGLRAEIRRLQDQKATWMRHGGAVIHARKALKIDAPRASGTSLVSFFRDAASEQRAEINATRHLTAALEGAARLYRGEGTD